MRMLLRAGGCVEERPMMPNGRPSPARGVKPSSGCESVDAWASTCGWADGWVCVRGGWTCG
jgi:hypothetical protein